MTPSSHSQEAALWKCEHVSVSNAGARARFTTFAAVTPRSTAVNHTTHRSKCAPLFPCAIHFSVDPGPAPTPFVCDGILKGDICCAVSMERMVSTLSRPPARPSGESIVVFLLLNPVPSRRRFFFSVRRPHGVGTTSVAAGSHPESPAARVFPTSSDRAQI